MATNREKYENRIAFHQKEIDRLRDILNEELPLIEEYKALRQEALVKIEAAESEAEAALNRAVALCDEYGIQHRFRITNFWKTYTPGAFRNSKFAAIEAQLKEEGLLDNEAYGGWYYSESC